MPKSTTERCWRLQVSNLQRDTSVQLLLTRLAEMPAFVGQTLSKPIRLTYPSATPHGPKRTLIFITVSGPPLARPLPKKLVMIQNQVMTTLWLADKGDASEELPREEGVRVSPLSSPRASPKLSPRATPRSPRSPVQPYARVSQSPLAKRGYHASPPSPIGRFRSRAPTASRQPTPEPSTSSNTLVPSRTATVQPGTDDYAMDLGLDGSPDWPSYLNQSPLYSPAASQTSRTSMTPRNSPLHTSFASTFPPVKPMGTWPELPANYANLPTAEAVDHLATLLKGCMPFLASGGFGTSREEEVEQAFVNAEFNDGLARWEAGLQGVRTFAS